MSDLFRYVINGLFATAVHYLVLNFNVQTLGFPSAGLANGVASVFGITVSFLGNRYFVFRGGRTASFAPQAARFLILYVLIALLHTGVMWLWADYSGFNYRVGFVIATGLQFLLSFVGNRRYVLPSLPICYLSRCCSVCM